MNFTPSTLRTARLSSRPAVARAFVEQLEDRCLLTAALPGLLGGGITGMPAASLEAGLQAGVVNTNSNNPSAFATGGATNSVSSGVGALNPLGNGSSGSSQHPAGGTGAAGIGPSTSSAAASTGTSSRALLVGAVFSGTASLNRTVPVSTGVTTRKPGMTLSFASIGKNGLISGATQVQGLGTFNLTGLTNGSSFHGVLSGPGAGTITGRVSSNNLVLTGTFSELQGGVVVHGSYRVTTTGTGTIAQGAAGVNASGTAASSGVTISSSRVVPNVGGTFSGTLRFSKPLTSSFGGGVGASGVGTTTTTSVNAFNINVTSEMPDGLVNGILNVQSLGDSTFVGVVTGTRVDLIFDGSGGSGEVVGTLSRSNSTLSGTFTDTLNGQTITGRFTNVNAALTPTATGATGTSSSRTSGVVVTSPITPNTGTSAGTITAFPITSTSTTTTPTSTTNTGVGATVPVINTGATGVGGTTTPVNSITGIGSTTMPVTSNNGIGGIVTVTQPVTSTGGITSSTGATSSSLSNTTGSTTGATGTELASGMG
ncbi:MAG: hypothetical protein JWL69_3440 [Phycisphaerales bacterium]|nr:hypothetical protein [Phycisphaerales bacterium]